MLKGVSIIICTYNGKTRLAKTLEHLVNQKHSCLLEIVLVDNASIDGTKDFADSWWARNGISSMNYKSFSQPIPGKSFAQELGYEKANYEYLLICDDDNWLANNYVQDAFDIMESNAEIGALGGWCEATFEKMKPVWFNQYARYYAVSKQGIESGDVTNKKGCLYGAGMMIRKSHWIRLNELGFEPLLTCRKGDTLSSGGDTEYSYVLRLLGYKMWYDERLYFKHFMPEGRLSLQYITKIRKAISASNFVVSVYVDELENRTVLRKSFLKRFLKMVRKDFINSVKKRISGSFEDKEVAKEYFRTLSRLIFSYNDYRSNRATIKRWLPTK
jgi:glycosyltransferase involved in cell wall biosynthesis